MGDASEGSSFWKSFPGILTATAAIITAVTGLIAVLNQSGCFKLRPPGGDARPSPTAPPSPNPSPTGLPTRPPDWATTLNDVERKRLDGLRFAVRQDGPTARTAESFAAILRGKAHFTVLALDGCDASSVRRAIAVVPIRELVLLPGSGAGCYRVCWGLFTSERVAKDTGSAVNERLRRSGLPADSRIVRVSSP